MWNKMHNLILAIKEVIFQHQLREANRKADFLAKQSNKIGRQTDSIGHNDGYKILD